MKAPKTPPIYRNRITLSLATLSLVASCTQDTDIADLSGSTNPVEQTDFCGGEVAERVFSFAVCSCEDLALAGGLRTFAMGAGDGSGGAAVGVNQGVRYAGEFDVDGTVEIGESDLAFAGSASINGDLAVGGDVTYAGSLDVSRNVTTEGRLIGIGGLDVGGQQSQGAVGLPCGCGDNELLDIAAAVDAAASENDNGALGVDGSTFSAVVGTRELALSGGSVYLDSVAGAGKLRIVASAPTKVFIGGDVANAGSIEAAIEGEGALDIFIKGNLSIAGSATFGPIDNPGKVRVYVSGDGNIAMAGGAKFAGNLYAPRARVSAAGSLDVHGALFARDIALAGSLNVVHDRAVQSAGEECTPPAEPPVSNDPPTDPPANNDPPVVNDPPNTCDSSLSCDTGLVCSDAGTCDECLSDADCEGAQVCQAGACGPLIR